jgi:hypothetical protein
MKENLYISALCSIENFKVIRNGISEYSFFEDKNFEIFIKSVYKNYQINYPKFYKMDNLCKLAFLTAEILLLNEDVNSRYKPEDVAVMLQNSSSTLHTDSDYHNTIKDESNYFPSPAIFVYTLPNIMTGEICIRHKFMGENTTIISPVFNKETAYQNIRYIFNNKLTQACITGWVELGNSNDSFRSELYLIERLDINNRNIIFGVNF